MGFASVFNRRGSPVAGGRRAQARAWGTLLGDQVVHWPGVRFYGSFCRAKSHETFHTLPPPTEWGQAEPGSASPVTFPHHSDDFYEKVVNLSHGPFTYET